MRLAKDGVLVVSKSDIKAGEDFDLAKFQALLKKAEEKRCEEEAAYRELLSEFGPRGIGKVLQRD